MQHFQSILIVIGLIAIGGVLVHGYFVGRKEKKSVTERGTNVDIFAEKAIEQEQLTEPVDEVVSEVRIISKNNEELEPDAIDFSKALSEEKVDDFDFNDNQQVKEPVKPLDSSDMFAQETTQTLPPSDKLEAPSVVVGESEETKLSTDGNVETDSRQILESNAEEVTQTQDLFIFNVAAREGLLLGGHELLQFFLTSGFRHGEMSIFHRHANSDGTGPVLFSIANMMAPGVFDTDNMEQFKSQGVSFFLTAPNKDINIKESFDLMLRAVEQMAEEFDCDVLNAEREKMTTAQFIEYNNRLLHYI